MIKVSLAIAWFTLGEWVSLGSSIKILSFVKTGFLPVMTDTVVTADGLWCKTITHSIIHAEYNTDSKKYCSFSVF